MRNGGLIVKIELSKEIENFGFDYRQNKQGFEPSKGTIVYFLASSQRVNIIKCQIFDFVTDLKKGGLDFERAPEPIFKQSLSLSMLRSA